MLNPQRPQSPPLNALRAFEAAARLGQFAAAAEELSVTPGAISQQIKTLEHWAGQQLFHRSAGRVDLTDAGMQILQPLKVAFDEIGIASQILRAQKPRQKITIAAQPSVAQLWLQPRLSQIQRNHPTLDVAVHAVETPPNLGRTEFDLSIFLLPDPAGAYKAWPDMLQPMCTAETLDTLREQDWSQVPRLLDANWVQDWDNWCAGTGQAPIAPGSITQFSLYSMALHAAQNGLGVLMVHSALGGNDTLVAADPQKTASGLFLCLHVAKRRIATPEIAAILNSFCD